MGAGLDVHDRGRPDRDIDHPAVVVGLDGVGQLAPGGFAGIRRLARLAEPAAPDGAVGERLDALSYQVDALEDLLEPDHDPGEVVALRPGYLLESERPVGRVAEAEIAVLDPARPGGGADGVGPDRVFPAHVPDPLAPERDQRAGLEDPGVPLHLLLHLHEVGEHRRSVLGEKIEPDTAGDHVGGVDPGAREPLQIVEHRLPGV